MEERRAAVRNLGDVYRHIYWHKNSSRQTIAADLGISLPTVANNLNQLREQGLICIAGEFESTGGRKANRISFVPDARLAVGVDITKTYMSFVLVDLNLNLLDQKKLWITYENTDEYYRLIGSEAEEMLQRSQVDRSRFLGIGISLPVIVGEGRNTIIYAEVIDVPPDFHERLKQWIPYPFLLFNDANSAGWAELWTRGNDYPMVYLSLSNSVGGAIVLNKRVYAGSNWRGAEFGHMTVVPNGKKCYCGSRGCLDVYCSAGVLSDFTGGDIREFFRRLKEADSRGYRRVFEQYMEHLSVAVNNLRMCFDCDVVLGGNVGACMEDHIEEFRRIVEKRTPFEDNAEYVKTCSYRTEPSAVGAALYYIDAFIRHIGNE